MVVRSTEANQEHLKLHTLGLTENLYFACPSDRVGRVFDWQSEWSVVRDRCWNVLNSCSQKKSNNFQSYSAISYRNQEFQKTKL